MYHVDSIYMSFCKDFISTIAVYEVAPEEREMKQRTGGSLLWNWCLVVQWSRMYYEWEPLNYPSIMYLLPHLHATYTQIKGWKWWYCSKLESNNKLEDKRTVKLGFRIIGELCVYSIREKSTNQRNLDYCYMNYDFSYFFLIHEQ